MSSIATAIIGSAVVGAYSARKAGKAQAGAIKEGAAIESATAEKNLALQEKLTNQQRQDFKPWREAGGKALKKMVQGIESGAYQVGDFNVKQDPSYQFRLNEGLKSVDRAASASGRLESGAYDKAITRYSQDYASTEYANAYARNLNEKNREFNMIAGLSDAGQNSAAKQAGATGQLANNAGNILANQGRAGNVAATNAGGAKANAYAGMATAFNQGAQNWLTYNGAK